MIIELRFDYHSSFASVPDGYITNGKELQESFLSWVEDQPENIIITKDGRAAVGYSDEDIIKATPHNAARADSEKIWVLMMALFRRCTLCTSRKSDEIRTQIFRKMPQAYCAVLP